MPFAFVKRSAPVAAVALIVGVLAVRHVTTAERRTAAQPAAGAAVRTVPSGVRVGGDPGKKGDTYYWLESRIVRSKARLGDTVVETDRRGDGKLHAKVVDGAGNDHGEFTGSSTLLQFRQTTGEIVQAQNDSSERLTHDWVARQAYGLARDGASNLVWDGGLMRSRRATRHDADKELDELETVWADGIVAKLDKHDFPPHEIAPGRIVKGAAWVTTLTVNGTPAGHSIWFERDQVFGYSLPGLMDGLVWIGPEHVKEQYGGWPFKPDASWLNLQTIAAYHFRTLMARQGSVAKACEPPRQNRLAQFFFPTVHANEPGCDGFHYLDGTILRQCCDDHDRCYAKNGCSSNTWWQFWTSWTCTFCNAVVVSCFYISTNIDPCLARSWWSC
jgi:hypothetical protein